jgi:hypothetical protein
MQGWRNKMRRAAVVKVAAALVIVGGVAFVGLLSLLFHLGYAWTLACCCQASSVSNAGIAVGDINAHRRTQARRAVRSSASTRHVLVVVRGASSVSLADGRSRFDRA